MNNWKTYILRCHDNSLYTGVTTDIERRVKEHNAGTGAKYTRSRLPCSLAWLKEGFTESEAKKEEARIKKLSKGDKEKMITS